MAIQELRRLTSTKPEEIVRVVNGLVDMQLGSLGTRSRLIGQDGTRKNIQGGSSLATGEYTQIIQSAASGGPALAVLHSSVANGATVAATPVNATFLANDTYIGAGRGTPLRLYGAGGTNYASLAGDNNGTLTLSGVGAGAGDLSMADLTVTSLTLNTADTSAAVRTLLFALEAGVTKWRMGLTATDTFTLINIAGNTSTFSVDDSGNALVPGTLGVTGRVTAAGATLSSTLLFTADATHDIGAAGATRPRDLYLSSSVSAGTTPATAGAVRLGNNLAINARNVGNSADIRMIRLNNGDVLETGQGGTTHTLLGTVVAPTVDPPTVDGQVTKGALGRAFAFVTGGGGATLGDNYNIASVVRNAAGDFTLAFDRDFVGTTYAVLVTVQDNGSNLLWRVNGQAAGSCDIHFRDTAGVLTDPDGFSVWAAGTLA